MPDVNIQATLTVTKSNSTLQGVGFWDITQQTSTKRNNASIQNVGVSPGPQLTFGSVSPLGYLFIKNLGSVNVSVALNNSTNAFATLRPGEFLLLPPATSTLYAWSASSTADLQLVAAES